MFAALSGWFTVPEYLSADEAYACAKTRFTRQTIDVNGVPHVCLSDPLIGMRVMVAAGQPVEWVFREAWKNRHERNTH
jgi:hypothetical protein